jgi:predicted phosphodiesterase
MQKKAIISDIHGNLEALTAVLEDIKQRNVEAIYCLGDVIGYGPNPVQCLEEAFRVCEFILLGNHEEAVLTGAFGFHPAAKEAVDWTRRQLKPSWCSLSNTRTRWEILKNLPLSYTEDDCLFVHGSPRDPTMEYILKSDTDDLFGDVPEKIKEIFEQVDRICFVGHTHTPGIITQNSQWFNIQDFDYVWEHKSNEKIICNVGSVGQPRDKDNRASYVTFNDKEICYHRIPYDFIKTQERIRKIPQLDNRNADRLEFGT